MELKDYLKILAKSWLLVAAATIALGFFGYFQPKFAKPSYQAFVTFQTTLKPQQASPNVYSYDSYYPLQAAASLTDTIAGLVSSPNTVVEVYKKAGLPLPASDFRRLAKAFRHQKLTPNDATLSVFVSSANQDEAKKIIETLGQEILNQIESQKLQGLLSKDFVLSASPSAVVAKSPSSRNQAVILGLVGLVSSSVLVLLRHYLGG